MHASSSCTSQLGILSSTHPRPVRHKDKTLKPLKKPKRASPTFLALKPCIDPIQDLAVYLFLRGRLWGGCFLGGGPRVGLFFRYILLVVEGLGCVCRSPSYDEFVAHVLLGVLLTPAIRSTATYKHDLEQCVSRERSMYFGFRAQRDEFKSWTAGLGFLGFRV